jgi:hypothetical protein
MDYEPCLAHPDYDGTGDPPDPSCPDCQAIQDAVAGA